MRNFFIFLFSLIVCVSSYAATLPTLSACASFAATDIFLARHSTDTSDCKATGTQLKAGLALNNVENTALSTWAGSTSLTTLGTIGTGTWNGSVIAGQYGGTGVNNSGKTITLGGNFTTSGANATTLTTSGATNVTLPTTGTLYGTETGSITSADLLGSLTNETGTGSAVFSNSPSFTTPNIGTATGSITGNAGTATALQTARNIGGTSFNGTADIVPQTVTIANEASDTTTFPLFATAATGDLQPKTNTSLKYDSSTGDLYTGTNATRYPMLGGDGYLYARYDDNSSKYPAILENRHVSLGSNGGVGILFNMADDTTTTAIGAGRIGAFKEQAWTTTASTQDSYLMFSPAVDGAITARMRLYGSGSLTPNLNDGTALGTTSLSWSDLFLASGAVLNINNGNWVATHTSGILTVGTGDLRVTTAGTNTASVVTVGGTQTLTNKTLTSPTMTSPVLGAASATSLTLSTDLAVADGGTGASTKAGAHTGLGIVQEYCFAASDFNTTTLTAQTSQAIEYLPAAFTVTGVRAYVRTAPSGLLTIDINESGSTILSTKLTIDSSEKTSGTAATPPVISDTAIAANAEITVDIDSTTGGKGLVVCLQGTF